MHVSSHRWVVDCGASRHIVPHESCLSTVDPPPSIPYPSIVTADGTSIAVTVAGTVLRPVMTARGVRVVKLSGVLVVPSVVFNLFSCVWGYDADGIRTLLNHERQLILPDGAAVDFLGIPGRYHVSLAPPRGGAAGRAHRTPSNVAPPRPPPAALTIDESLDTTDELIHRRLAHFSLSRIRHAHGKVKGLNLDHYKGHDNCEACAKGAIRSQRYSKKPKTDTPPLFTFFGECVTSDLAGPFPPSIVKEYIHAIVFFDRYSKYLAVYYLTSTQPTMVKSAFLQFISDHKNWLKDGRVHEWYTDNGPEFRSNELDAFCSEMSIRRSASVPYQPNTNAHAERSWGILLRPTRAIASTIENGARWWPFIMSQVRRIHVSLPTSGHDPPTPPLVLANPKVSTPDLSTFRVMLCRCIVKIRPSPTGNKIAERGCEAMYLGHDERRRGHFVYLLDNNRITTVAEREIKFFENEIPKMELEGNTAPHFVYWQAQNELPTPIVPTPDDERDDPPTRTPPRATAEDEPEIGPTIAQRLPRRAASATIDANVNRAQQAVPRAVATDFLPQPSTHDAVIALLPERTQTYHTLTVKMDKALYDGENSALLAWCGSSYVHEPVQINLATIDPIPIPRNAEEALSGPYQDKWLTAMKEDLEGKARNGMSKSMEHDGREPVMKGKWVFAVKYNPDHSVKKFRARWVAKGFSQIEGLHYHETFSATMRSTSTRVLLASSVGTCKKTGEQIQRRHVDVDKAFTHSDMDCRVIMEQPHGFGTKGKVDLLLKALEGTKQAGHLWQELNSSKMRAFGLKQSTIDPCLFYLERGDQWLRIGVFVDDILAVFNSEKLFDEFFKFYQKNEPQIRCHDDSDVERFTGLEVITSRDNTKLTIHQKCYIETIFAKYGAAEHSKLWNSPVGSTREELEKFMNITGAKTDDDKARVAGKDFLGLIGSLLYATCQTRPDLQYHVSHLAQFMGNPSLEAYNAAIGVLCYLYRTRDLGITYGGPIEPPPVEYQAESDAIDAELLTRNDGLLMFTDASFARDIDLRSVNGFVAMYKNGAVSWASKGLKIVCQSTTEAETAGASVACKDLKYIRAILTDIGLPAAGPTPLLIDSSGTYGYTRHQSAKQRTKYFELWVTFVREAHRNLEISLHLITTDTEVADALTKALAKGELARYRDYMLNTKAGESA